jgi:alkylation response protein AidB-like acyl-CoA dehydrogenase
MNFSINEEQAMLADSVARFIDNDYSFEQRMKIAEDEAAFSRDMWKSYAELGWTAVLFDEQDGGLGGGPVELMLMMEQFGRGLVVEPFLANIVLAGGVLKRAASPAQKEEWLTGIIEGRVQAALAFAEPQARFDIANIACSARKEGDEWLLRGDKTMVLNGGDANLLIVPARTSGTQTERGGITLFTVATDGKGVLRKAYKTVDAHGAAELGLQDVRVGQDRVLGPVGEGYEILREVIDDATLAVCAEATGIIRVMHDKTVEYAKQRVQFGVPIGTFQALQHRMVDTLMACEQTRSLLLWASMLQAEGSADASKAISALKYQVGTAGRRVAEEAVQIHGGMGVTWEMDIAHYFKRMTAIGILFGNADYHLDRYTRAT